MAEAALTCVVEKLSKLLIHHRDLISGAEIEVHLLMDDLNSLKTLFLELEKKQKDEGPFREIERQIKEVVYDVEDTIDTFSTIVRKHSRHHPGIIPFSTIIKIYSRPSPNIIFHVDNAIDRFIKDFLMRFGLYTRQAKKVRRLRENKVKPILEAFKATLFTLAFSYAPSTCAEQLRYSRPIKDHAISIDNIVGRDDDRRIIIGYLVREDNKEVDVISIIGMTGLGKTTLAWRIYEDWKFADYIRIWIHVPDKSETRDVCHEILRKVGNNMSSQITDGELIQEVWDCLRNQAFLLVLDDVCSLDYVKAIKAILPKGSGSKVLITSSNNVVGACANVHRKPHSLRFLNKEESWELLKLQVFSDLNDCPCELEKVGRIIGDMCGGLPVQIVAVGEILAATLTKTQNHRGIEEEWHKVAKSLNLLLHKEKSILNVVELRYNILPEGLRECFLYTGLFPESHKITAWALTRMWIAEGFIQPKYGQSLEETAMQNLDDLINMNLVMVDKINLMGEVTSCHMHSMIRGFCIYKAREQNLFQQMKVSRQGVIEPSISELQRSRRLCVYSDANTLLSRVPSSSRVRSLLCFNEVPIGLDPSSVPTILDALDLLKVLTIRLHQLPRGFTRLFHLRYITLFVDNLITLPKSLSELWELQTLVVNTKSRSIKMKANIWRLMQLRHFKTNAAVVLSLKGDKRVAGENLQTLSGLSPESCSSDMCKRAPNLKKLVIRGNLRTLLEKSFVLKNLDSLEKLKLANDLFYENALLELPQTTVFPPNVKQLTLSKTFLKWKHMSTLAKINTLEVLKLKDNAFTGIYWSASKDCFTRLHLLLIAETDLVHWEASTDSFPSLRYLVLKNCENLNKIPVEVAENLEKLDTDILGESAVQSTKIMDMGSKSKFELSIHT